MGNNPINYIDPTGYKPARLDDEYEDGPEDDFGSISLDSILSGDETFGVNPLLAAIPLGLTILLDENLDGAWLEDQLTKQGYNVIRFAQTGLQRKVGTPDTAVQQWAAQNNAWILTKNWKDFPGYQQLIALREGAQQLSRQQMADRMQALADTIRNNPAVLNSAVHIAASGRVLVRTPLPFLVCPGDCREWIDQFISPYRPPLY